MGFLWLLKSQKPGFLEYDFVYLDRKTSVWMFKRSASRVKSVASIHTSPGPVQHLPHSVQLKRLPLT